MKEQKPFIPAAEYEQWFIDNVISRAIEEGTMHPTQLPGDDYKGAPEVVKVGSTDFVELIETPLSATLALASALESQVGGDHYKKLKIQPIEYILANNLSYVEGNIIKYITRWKDKGGVQDLEKIKHYCDLLIEGTK